MALAVWLLQRSGPSRIRQDRLVAGIDEVAVAGSTGWKQDRRRRFAEAPVMGQAARIGESLGVLRRVHPMFPKPLRHRQPSCPKKRWTTTNGADTWPCRRPGSQRDGRNQSRSLQSRAPSRGPVCSWRRCLRSQSAWGQGRFLATTLPRPVPRMPQSVLAHTQASDVRPLLARHAPPHAAPLPPTTPPAPLRRPRGVRPGAASHATSAANE